MNIFITWSKTKNDKNIFVLVQIWRKLEIQLVLIETKVFHIPNDLSFNIGKNVITSDGPDRRKCFSKMDPVISSISNIYGRSDKAWFYKRKDIHRTFFITFNTKTRSFQYPNSFTESHIIKSDGHMSYGQNATIFEDHKKLKLKI